LIPEPVEHARWADGAERISRWRWSLRLDRWGGGEWFPFLVRRDDFFKARTRGDVREHWAHRRKRGRWDWRFDREIQIPSAWTTRTGNDGRAGEGAVGSSALRKGTLSESRLRGSVQQVVEVVRERACRLLRLLLASEVVEVVSERP
jgi:hypothetical protein